LSEYMGFGDFLKSNFNKVKQAGEKTGRFIGTTGRSALRKLGEISHFSDDIRLPHCTHKAEGRRCLAMTHA
jgi:hypothetical protein